MLRRHRRERAGIDLADKLDGIIPSRWKWNAADIGNDADQPFALDDRTDIVEDHGAHGRRSQARHDHGEQAAARRADNRHVVEAQ